MTFQILPLLYCLVLGALSPLVAPPTPAGGEIAVSDASAPGDGSQPLVAGLVDGGFVVVWNTRPTTPEGTASSAIVYRLFGADGAAAGDATPLHPEATEAEAASDVAAEPDGGFLVAWTASSTGAAGRSLADFVQRVDASGTPAAAWQIDDTGASPRLAVARGDEDGGFAVAWEATSSVDSDPATVSHTLLARRYSATGEPQAPVVQVVTSRLDPGSAAQTGAAVRGLALENDGSLVVLYEQTDPDAHLFLQRVTAGGSLRGPATVPFRPAACCLEQFGGSLTAALDGSLTVVFTGAPPAAGDAFPPVRQASILGGRFGRDGSPLGRVSQLSRASVGVARQPAIAALPQGGFVLVWAGAGGARSGGDGTGIFGRSFVANGVPRTPDYRLSQTSSGGEASPAVAALPDGGAVAVWIQASGAIVARRLAPPRGCGSHGCG